MVLEMQCLQDAKVEGCWTRGHSVLGHGLPVLTSAGIFPTYGDMLVYTGRAMNSLVPSYRASQMCRCSGPCPCHSGVWETLDDGLGVFGLSWVCLPLHHGHEGPWNPATSPGFIQNRGTATSILESFMPHCFLSGSDDLGLPGR